MKKAFCCYRIVPNTINFVLHVQMFKFDDTNTCLIWLQEQLPDIYPYELVNDTENGVIGSCSTYRTRKDVTSIIRNDDFKPLLSYEDVVERYMYFCLMCVFYLNVLSKACSLDWYGKDA